MKRAKINLKWQPAILLFVAMFLFSATGYSQSENAPSGTKLTHRLVGNPYLPLWEHLPDGEPRVFEDPDNPGNTVTILSVLTM
jgi:arabinoxylan arabinofuranohydrolase